jgi:hypothetical protein
MKKLIAKLSLRIFSLGLCVNLSAEEWRTYKFTQGGSQGVKDTYSEDVITLEKGDKAEFVNLITAHNNYAHLRLKISLDDEHSMAKDIYSTHNKEYNGNHLILQNFETIYGPCKLEVGAFLKSPDGWSAMWAMCNVKISRANESLSKNVTGYSLVLPESKDTNYNLVLESSTDLVSWTADATGTKTPSDKERFYRLRAVKE